MSDQYLGEIRMVGFNFAPYGWALCNGQILPISQNTALFSLLGTFYGGDGKSTFALPNLQARAPMGAGNGNGLTPRSQGETGGEYNVTLTVSTMAAHNHGVNCVSGAGASNTPAGNFWSSAQGDRNAPHLFVPTSTPANMNGQAIGTQGGNMPHNNLPPYLTVEFAIALQGIYPPRG